MGELKELVTEWEETQTETTDELHEILKTMAEQIEHLEKRIKDADARHRKLLVVLSEKPKT